LARQSDDQLVALLASESGTLRDMAQQELLQRHDKSIANLLRKVAMTSDSPNARVHALWILHGLDELQDADLQQALGDAHPGVVRNAIVLAEPRLSNHAANDPWLASAIVSSSRDHSLAVLEQFLAQLRTGRASAAAGSRPATAIADLIATAEAAGANAASLVARTLVEADENASWVFALAAASASTGQSAGKLDSRLREAVLSVYKRAKSLAADQMASPKLRCEALQLFGRSLGIAKEERSLLGELLSSATPLEVQLASAERLAAFRDRESAQVLLSRWPELSYSVRDAVALRLVSHPASVEALLNELESGGIAPGELSPAVRQTLRQSSSQALQARVNRVLGKATTVDQELIEQYLRFQQEASGAADLSRGRELFRKHCATCHTPDATGRATGPDLLNLSNRSPRVLTESILVPNRSVEARYYGYMVVTTDGRVLSGTIDEEAGDTLNLSLADGKRTTIQRSEIDELRDTRVSLMPDGFHRELDKGMLRDLVEYLRSEAFAQSREEL
jgi:putative heme-binding domain-containing protein